MPSGRKTIAELLLGKADLQVLRELSRFGSPRFTQKHGVRSYYVLRKQARPRAGWWNGRLFMATTQLATIQLHHWRNRACHADLAIINANIKTMNPKQPTAQAVAISRNKIIKVGSNQEIQALNRRQHNSHRP